MGLRETLDIGRILPLNKQLTKHLHQLALEAAKALEGKLPDHPSHPMGRIPIAHVYDVIKRVMGRPAKECDDSRFQDLVTIINFCRDNPDEPHCATACRNMGILPEPEIVEPSTLDSFFTGEL